MLGRGRSSGQRGKDGRRQTGKKAMQGKRQWRSDLAALLGGRGRATRFDAACRQESAGLPELGSEAVELSLGRPAGELPLETLELVSQLSGGLKRKAEIEVKVSVDGTRQSRARSPERYRELAG